MFFLWAIYIATARGPRLIEVVPALLVRKTWADAAVDYAELCANLRGIWAVRSVAKWWPKGGRRTPSSLH